VAAPTNNSPSNTGLKVLPPAQKAFIWYPYDASPEFPLVGAGGRNAMAGPVFYSDDFKNVSGAPQPGAFPAYYNGKLLAYEWMRGWIMAVTMDKEGNYVSMERFMPSYKFSNPMDMEFAQNGDLYMLEYGSGWFSANDDARLIRIEYNGGNRKPKIEMAANKQGGSAPLALKLTAAGTDDADGDALTYSWKITSKNGYTVNDGKGGISTQSLDVTVGNEAPVLSLDMPGANKSFFVPGKPFEYDVKVKDKEDGTLGGGIDADAVAVNIDYMPEGFDKVAIAQGHRSADASAAFATGKKLIEASDCKACHAISKKSIGPAYTDVARKYKGNSSAVETLTKKVINGGGGVWGETAMAAHPQLSAADASEMVKYILNLSGDAAAKASLPVKGSYTAALPNGDKGKGVFVVRAAYQDKGAKGLPALRSEQMFVLRNSMLDVHSFDVYDDVNKMAYGGNNLAIPAKSGAYMGLKQVDLNGVSAFRVMAMAPKPQLNALGGKVELRLDSPTGKLIGESAFLEPTDKMDFKPSTLDIPIKLPVADGKPHDVYMIFVNPSKSSGSLMVVMSAQAVLASTAQ
jgi:cytochrome c